MSYDQLMQTEIQRTKKPRPGKLAIAISAAIAVVLITGGVVGVNVANDYRNSITASQTAAEQALALADTRANEAQAAAAEAVEASKTAQVAVTTVEAAEQAAIAAAAAQAAAEAAEAAVIAAKPAPKNGTNGPTKCPAGSAPGEVDGNGNERLCAPTGPQGQTCAEYDGPTCVAWLEG